ncbi:MAG: MFS transporter [Burkholderiaceae bacterium]|nr:MFS transporter [Burkholderiaceae bacterium]
MKQELTQTSGAATAAAPASAASAAAASAAAPFSGYQKITVAMLAFLQFAVILDFMLMSPLGAVIMPTLRISPSQFGVVVSAYAFSAGIAGLLTAGIADRYDRKRLLLFFYTGFILGTLWCGMAQSFESLLAARIVTGLFGGVIGSVVLAIATDLFAPAQRGRVMGLIQTAFAASQVLGLPAGIYLSNQWNWHAPFLAMAAFGLCGGLLVAWQMQPVNAHLKQPQEHSAWLHLYHTLTEREHLLAFAITALLSTGGFMLMPFGSAYVVNNLGISLDHLPTIYLVTGLCTIFIGPLVGKASDSFGKFRVYLFGTVLSIVMVLIYTHLGQTSLAVLIVVNTVLFIGIFSRMIPVQAMMSGVPVVTKRGAFNAISASIQQLSGGLASVLAGHIVVQAADGHLQHFDRIGYVVVASAVGAMLLVWRLHRQLATRTVQN